MVPLYETLIQKISIANTKFVNDIEEHIDATLLTFKFLQAKATLQPDQARRIEENLENIKRDVRRKDNKLKSYYILNYSIMDLIDPQFYVMYLIKCLRILFAYVSLFLATRIFSPIYESAVYDNQGNPPALALYTGLYLALDLAFNAFLFVLLYLLRVIFSAPDGEFIIDKYLFKKYITDYIISTLFLLAISNLLAIVITNKKYFKYKYEGLRAIRAFEQMMFNMSTVVYMFPFFWVL